MAFNGLTRRYGMSAALATPLVLIKLWVLLRIGYYPWPLFVGDVVVIVAVSGLAVLLARWRPLRSVSWPVAWLLYALTLLVELGEAVSYYFQAGTFNDRFFANIRLGNLQSALDAFTGPAVAVVLVLVMVLAGAAWLLARQGRLRVGDASLHGIFKGIALAALVLVAAGVPSAWHRLATALTQGGSDALADTTVGRALAEQLHVEGAHREGLQASAGKNLVIIYMESLERIYTDNQIFPGLTPNLNQWRAKGLDFSGYLTFPGATYTMAGIFASQCGAPFFTTPSEALDFTADDANASSFQPELACLGDVLHVAGYAQTFMTGTRLSFADQGTFFHMHGFDHVLGLDQLEAANGNDLPSPGWGLYDRDLFRIATAKFDKLAASGKPFNLDVLTIDNHPPHGRPSPGCPKYATNANDVLQAVHCTDYLVGKLLDTISQSPAWQDTIVVVMSDHQSLRNDAWPLYPKSYQRRPLLFILNGGQGDRDMRFYHMDIAPTVLHLMGVKTNATFLAGADRSEPHASGSPLVNTPTEVAVLRKAVWQRAQPLAMCRGGILIGPSPDGFTVGGKSVPLSEGGVRLVGIGSGQALALLVGRSDVVGVVADSAEMSSRLQQRGSSAALLIRPLTGADPLHQFSLTWISSAGGQTFLGDVPRLYGLQVSSPQCASLLRQANAVAAGEKLDFSGKFDLHTAPLYPTLLRYTDFSTDSARPLQRGIGWLAPAKWGGWTFGDVASLGFALPSGGCHGARLAFTVQPFLEPSRPNLDVRVLANDKLMTTWHFSAAGGSRISTVETPVATSDKACHVDLRFEFSRPGLRPSLSSADEDSRPLQLDFRQMKLLPPGG